MGCRESIDDILNIIIRLSLKYFGDIIVVLLYRPYLYLTWTRYDATNATTCHDYEDYCLLTYVIALWFCTLRYAVHLIQLNSK